MPWNDLHAYWQNKHIGAHPPSRRDLDPIIEIPRLAKNLFLVNIDPEGFRYRLIGSEITRRLGRDPTGQLVRSQLFGASLLVQWIGALEAVATSRQAQLLLSRTTDNIVTEMLTLLLPLVQATGEIEMILGGSFFQGSFREPAVPPGLETVDLRSLLPLVA